jgi:glycosyltransferase involved in cell wall biosynthesis
MSFEVKQNLVSVVVASYNHAEYLVQRMESLLNQTYQYIEILVIDDCSTDNSVEILRKFEIHSKVKLILREKNGGWVAVSNQGAELASGEFLIFANCDDACDPRMIERLVERMRENPTAAISYCRSLMINEDGQTIGDDFSLREKSFRTKCTVDALIEKRKMSIFLLYSCVIPNLSAALFRTDCYKDSGGLIANYRVCSDWDLFFRIVNKHDVFYVAEPLNYFRQHTTTIRSRTKEKILYEEYFILLLGRLKQYDLTVYERNRVRLRVMYLWASHILLPNINGIVNFKFHLNCISSFDSYAILFLPFALIIRLFVITRIVLLNKDNFKKKARNG